MVRVIELGDVFYCTHYNDVIMSEMASEITSLTLVYSTVCSGPDQTKHQSSASLAFVRGIHRGPVNSPVQRTSNAENISIWWRHHEDINACFCNDRRTFIFKSLDGHSHLFFWNAQIWQMDFITFKSLISWGLVSSAYWPFVRQLFQLRTKTTKRKKI